MKYVVAVPGAGLLQMLDGGICYCYSGLRGESKDAVAITGEWLKAAETAQVLRELRHLVADSRAKFARARVINVSGKNIEEIAYAVASEPVLTLGTVMCSEPTCATWCEESEVCSLCRGVYCLAHLEVHIDLMVCFKCSIDTGATIPVLTMN